MTYTKPTKHEIIGHTAGGVVAFLVGWALVSLFKVTSMLVAALIIFPISVLVGVITSTLYRHYQSKPSRKKLGAAAAAPDDDADGNPLMAMYWDLMKGMEQAIRTQTAKAPTAKTEA